MTNFNPLKVLSIVLEDDYKLKCEFIPITFLDVECQALITKYFVIIQHNEQFYISFCLNSSSIYESSYFTKALTIILQEKLITYTEHFLDRKTCNIYFGKQAYIKYEEYINSSKKIKKCELCERYYPFELFKYDNNFCVVCNEVTLKTAIFH